jgi:F-type H+-transporting ATPase subunit b
MLEILQQLEGYFIAAIPTAVLFIALVAAYQFLIQGPLTAVLKERRARTEGAVEDARKAIAQAEERAAEYAQKLRQARAEILKAREQRVQTWIAERDAVLEQTRKAAAKRVEAARAELEGETARARQAIQASAADLAQQVVGAVLPAAAGGAR